LSTAIGFAAGSTRRVHSLLKETSLSHSPINDILPQEVHVTTILFLEISQ
jgi:hypothetical protein